MGIPDELPTPKPYDAEVNHAPKRKDILLPEEKKLAIEASLKSGMKGLKSAQIGQQQRQHNQQAAA